MLKLNVWFQLCGLIEEATVRLRYLAALVMTAPAAASIAVAPFAAAAPQPSCKYLGLSNTQCQVPGNVQINDAPPIQYAPQYPIDPFFSDGMRLNHGGSP